MEKGGKRTFREGKLVLAQSFNFSGLVTISIITSHLVCRQNIVGGMQKRSKQIRGWQLQCSVHSVDISVVKLRNCESCRGWSTILQMHSSIPVPCKFLVCGEGTAVEWCRNILERRWLISYWHCGKRKRVMRKKNTQRCNHC